MNKYNVGDIVHCFRQETEHVTGFNFTGRVLSIANVGYPKEDWEYDVENAPKLAIGFNLPCLIWEEEITGKV